LYYQSPDTPIGLYIFNIIAMSEAFIRDEVPNSITSDDVADWDELFYADADRFGNIRNVLFRTPEGVYVHASYKPGVSIKSDDGQFVTPYQIEQTGEDLTSEMVSGEEQETVLEDECWQFLTGDWSPVYDAHWSNNTVSVSTLMDGFEDDFDTDDLRTAGEHDITFELTIQ